MEAAGKSSPERSRKPPPKFNPKADVQEVGELQDALLKGKARGRGAQLNPGNRFETVRLHVLGEHLDEELAERPNGVQVATSTMDEDTKSIINHVNSPDISFSWTINPYRG